MTMSNSPPQDRQFTESKVNLGENSAFDLIGLTQIRNDPQFVDIDGSGFSVAVIDTGLDREHPLIAPNYVAGYDFIDRDFDPDDIKGHGTHISGIIGAVDRTIGVASGVGLIGLKAIDDDGIGSLNKIEESLEWVLANKEQYNITAVNLSFGIGFFTPESTFFGDIISDDIQRLEDAGVSVIAATGNKYFAKAEESNQANIAFPAIASTLAVGAVWSDGTQSNVAWPSGSIDYTTEADRIVSFSQRLDASNVIFAPGATIASTLPGGTTGIGGGTSQAAAHVAGAIALLQEASLQFSGHLLTPEEASEILRTTAESIFDGDDEDDNVSNTNLSYFRLDIHDAVSEVKRRSDSIIATLDNNHNSVFADFNDTIATAAVGPIVNGSGHNLIGSSIGADYADPNSSDVDIYSFQLISQETVNIEVISNIDRPNDFDSYLQLFDSSGNTIAVNDDIASDNTFSQIEVSLDSGTYYVGVSGSNNTTYDPNLAGSGVAGDTGNYTLKFGLSNSDPESLELDTSDINLDRNNDSEADTKIHRFFSSQTKVHFYTASVTERDFIIDNLTDYSYEGTTFASATKASDTLTGAKPVYRFFNTDTGGHLYTISEVEKESVNGLANYNFEGIAYYGYQSDPAGAVPLYRFYNSVADVHFYTPSVVERDAILTNLPNYQLESNDGIAFYVEPISEI